MALKSDAIFEKIGVRLTKIDPNERQVEHIFKFNITVNGAVAKSWILDLKNVKIFEGDDAGAEATLTISDEDMFALGSGKLAAKDALAQDKLDVDGDINVALKLSPFIASL